MKEGENLQERFFPITLTLSRELMQKTKSPEKIIILPVVGKNGKACHFLSKEKLSAALETDSHFTM